ncbi:methyltransferase domain-containing protein [Scatolibacter rhodanostii]|uniref:methyltransferase domain-containing protein n=1 Tax=Scatolibacter rhodanostii TaxID=2014781 RepID=UPI000C07B808|nr:methyltransferase domain-containing protein [Scatolibacter rhodanostii]
MNWNSEQYLKFEKERTKPARDLANEIDVAKPKKILDIGCGPGNSTAVLRKKYPDAEILGIDSSPEMIEQACQTDKKTFFRVFNASDDLTKLGTDFDVVFSNACIQWIQNHKLLIPNMMKCLKKGGILAIQTPMNEEEPIQKIIMNLVKKKEWADKIDEPKIFHNLAQNDYYDIFNVCAESFTLWQTTYFHIMENHEAIMDWYRGTGLRPYIQSLSSELADEFQKQVFEKVKRAYPAQQDGKIIFRFPRFFMLAEK